MKRYKVIYCNRFIKSFKFKSFDEMDKAIEFAKNLHNTFTFVEVIDSKTSKIVYEWSC